MTHIKMIISFVVGILITVAGILWFLVVNDPCDKNSLVTVSFHIPIEDMVYKLYVKPVEKNKDGSFKKIIVEDNYELVLSRNNRSATLYNDNKLIAAGKFYTCNKCYNSSMYVRWDNNLPGSGSDIYARCKTILDDYQKSVLYKKTMNFIWWLKVYFASR